MSPCFFCLVRVEVSLHFLVYLIVLSFLFGADVLFLG